MSADPLVCYFTDQTCLKTCNWLKELVAKLSEKQNCEIQLSHEHSYIVELILLNNRGSIISMIY